MQSLILAFRIPGPLRGCTEHAALLSLLTRPQPRESLAYATRPEVDWPAACKDDLSKNCCQEKAWSDKATLGRQKLDSFSLCKIRYKIHNDKVSLALSVVKQPQDKE